jgi:protein involved in sex pheromone biosynthesis
MMKNTKFIAILVMALALILSACGGKSDADIEKEVQGRIKTPGVTAKVKEGVVTLTGTVENQDASKAAETAAKGEGVKSVTNNIQIKPSTPPPTPMTTTANTNTGNTANKPGANTNAANKPK